MATPKNENDARYVLLHPMSLTVTEISEARIAIEHRDVEGIVDVKINQEMQDKLFELLLRERNKPNRTEMISFSMRGLVVRRA